MKALHTATTRHAPPHKILQLQQAANQANKHWIKARRQAEAKIKEWRLQRCSDIGNQPGHATHHVFKEFAIATGRHPSRNTSYLEPDTAARFWQDQFHSECEDVSLWPAFCNIHMTITVEQVTQAIRGMGRKAPGPDHMDFLAFQTFQQELAPPLSRLFTKALSQGLPNKLRESVTILLSKAGKPPTSTQPGDYRPITLLPMIVRIYHKILANRFTDEVESRHPNQGGIHATQAGFRRRRSCLDQAFTLRLLQAIKREVNPGHKQFLCALLLDIRKAFDSLEYAVIIRVLEQRGYPQEWLEIFRVLLPGNRTNILGTVIQQSRGSPQGGALSPILCNIVMNELASDLMQHIRMEPALGNLWRRGRTQREHRWQTQHGNSPYSRLLLLLLQFADDIAIFGKSAEETWKLFTITHAWADRVKLKLCEKSMLVLLSATSRSAAINDLDCDVPIQAGGLTLHWRMDTSFRYLGYQCQTAFSAHCYQPVTPMDHKKVRGLLSALLATFTLSPTKHYVAPLALTRGVEQLVYASALYQAPLNKLDYKKLQSTVLSGIRRILQVPATTPSPYILWELRHWPPLLRGHKRIIMAAYRMLHHSHIGAHIS